MLALNFYRILVTIIYYNFQQVVTTTSDSSPMMDL